MVIIAEDAALDLSLDLIPILLPTHRTLAEDAVAVADDKVLIEDAARTVVAVMIIIKDVAGVVMADAVVMVEVPTIIIKNHFMQKNKRSQQRNTCMMIQLSGTTRLNRMHRLLRINHLKINIGWTIFSIDKRTSNNMVPMRQ